MQAFDNYNRAYVEFAKEFGFWSFGYDIKDHRTKYWVVDNDTVMWWHQLDQVDSDKYCGDIIHCCDGDDVSVSACGGYCAIAYDDGHKWFGIFDMSKQIRR